MLINPYAIYVRVDAAMDHDSKSTGGVGVEITFPDSVPLQSISRSFGSYQGANIERLELQAIIKGMKLLLHLHSEHKDELAPVCHVIFITDRLSLSGQNRTNPYRIRQWRRDNWQTSEGKPLKNVDLLEEIDKTRQKLVSRTHWRVEIQYGRSKFIRRADKLSKVGKRQPPESRSIAVPGVKRGKRIYDGPEVQYSLLAPGDEFAIQAYLKEPVENQWAISADICDGRFLGLKLVIYGDSELEGKLHRGNRRRIRLATVLRHHVTIADVLEDQPSPA